jgi:hypothetical protein
MSKVRALLAERLKRASQKLSKMTDLAERSSEGQLSAFSGLFRVAPLSGDDEGRLRELLEEFSHDEQEILTDFKALSEITCEVKAIHNQAVLLHGERIKRAQEILKRYKEGAFSGWLLAAYGNRQTPYNFLQYFDLYTQLPQPVALQLEEMPKQVAYALANRDGTMEKKEELIRSYKGERREELLDKIRTAFPLQVSDKRGQDLPGSALKLLAKVQELCVNPAFKPSRQELEGLKKLLQHLLDTL